MAERSPALPPLEHEPERQPSAGPGSDEETVPHGGRPPAERMSWGWAVAALGILMIVGGAVLAAFPFISDFTSEAAATSLIVSGGITCFLGILRLTGVRHPAVGYVAMAVGAWLFASSFFVGELPREAWGARAFGAGLVFLGLLGITRPTPTRSGAPTSDVR